MRGEVAVVIERFNSDRPPHPVARIEGAEVVGDSVVVSEMDLVDAGYVKIERSRVDVRRDYPGSEEPRIVYAFEVDRTSASNNGTVTFQVPERELSRLGLGSNAAVDCCNPDHWFDNLVGWPGKHDGGLPEDPSTPCRTFAEEYGS